MERERLERKTRERDQQDTRDEATADGLTQNNELEIARESQRELERARESQRELERAGESQRADMELFRHNGDRLTN